MPKTILITGAASGFGRDMAETFKREGHRVFAAMRDIAGRNRAAAEALREMKIDVIEIDVASDTSVEAGVETALAASHNAMIDVVVNNAGIATFGVSEAFTSDQMRELYNTNVVGIHRIMRATLPAMRARRDGLFVNVSSIVARVSSPSSRSTTARKLPLSRSARAIATSCRSWASMSCWWSRALIRPTCLPLCASRQTRRAPTRMARLRKSRTRWVQIFRRCSPVPRLPILTTSLQP